jgi:anaerobic magnesium-protoporphyrin IX monomethyl ester cyclase
MAKISLVRPPFMRDKAALTERICPPLGLAYLASSLRDAGHAVQLIDGPGEDPMRMYPSPHPQIVCHGLTVEEIVSRIDTDTSIIGISSMFSCEWPMVKILIGKIREKFKEAMILLGGEHGTALPEFSLREAPELNCIVLGEGEVTAVNLIKAIEKGKSLSDVGGIAFIDNDRFVQTGLSKRTADLDRFPQPDWDQIPLDNYFQNDLSFGVYLGRTMPIIASRGCPYQCTFCSSPFMWTTQWVARDPEEVLAEMETYIEKYQIENFDFFDLTAIVRKDWIVEFCTLLIKKNWDITWQLPSGTRSEALDGEALPLLYKSGCRSIIYAPESGSPKILKKIKKKIKPEKLMESVGTCVKSKIATSANLILGLPEETKGDVLRTYSLLVDLALAGAHDIRISNFSPYPGSELFSDLQSKNQIPELDDHYFYSLLSAEEQKNNGPYTHHYSKPFRNRAILAGYLLFFGLSYLRRPWRFGRMISNLIAHRRETLIDDALNNLEILKYIRSKKASNAVLSN